MSKGKSRQTSFSAGTPDPPPQHSQLMERRESTSEAISVSSGSTGSNGRGPHGRVTIIHGRVNNYIVGGLLGIGTFGRVRLAQNTIDGKFFAMKQLEPNKTVERYDQLRRRADQDGQKPRLHGNHVLTSSEKQMHREIAVMMRLEHPHVVKLIEVIREVEKNKLYMVLEYMEGGEVKWKDPNGGPLNSLDQANRIFRDALLGLEYIHSQGIVHRDIKPANLLMSADRRSVKLSDFGVSACLTPLFSPFADRVPPGEEQFGPRFLEEPKAFAGTPPFMAPEVCTTTSPDASQQGTPTAIKSSPKRVDGELKFAVDIWALGVTYYCLLFGSLPWDPESYPDLPNVGRQYRMFKDICEQPFPVPEFMGNDRVPTGGRGPWDTDELYHGQNVIGILTQMLEKDPEKRATIGYLKHHPYVERFVDSRTWFAVTRQPFINPTEDEVASAITPGKWAGKVVRGISKIKRKIVGPAPDPSLEIGRHSSEALERSRSVTTPTHKRNPLRRAPSERGCSPPVSPTLSAQRSSRQQAPSHLTLPEASTRRHLSPSPARSSKAPSSSSLPSPFGASSSSSETANKPPSFPFFRKASKHGHSGTHTPSSANSEYAPSTAPLLGPSRPDILSHSRRPSEDTVTQSQHAVPTQATGTVDDPEAATTSDTSAGPTQTRFEDSDEDSGQEDLGQVQSGWYMTSGVEPNRYFEGAPPDHGFPSQPNSAHPTSAPGSSYPTGSLDMYERPRSPVRSAPAIQDAWPHSARSHPTSPLSRGSMDSYMPADTEAEGSRRTGPLYEDEDDSEDERPVELNMTRRRGTHSTTLSTPSSTPSSP